MKWFQHDSDAHWDGKLKRLQNKYGLEGLGLYWCIVEMIAKDMSPKNILCELEWGTELLAEEFKVEQIKIESILNFCCTEKLFDHAPNGNIRCLKLMERLDNTLSKSADISKMKGQKRKFAFHENKLFESEERLPLDENRLDEIKEEKIRLERVLGRELLPRELEQLNLSNFKDKEATA